MASAAAGSIPALFDEGEAERGVPAAQQALDDAARVDSTLVASRLNTLLHAVRPYETTAVNDVRNRAKLKHMAKHRRPGPPNQPSRAVPRVDADNPLAAYEMASTTPDLAAAQKWGHEAAPGTDAADG
ncbi:hypothetical protein [Streptomyces vilmorinianum]|uniref:hypothetical protein n=1 Tax=Streptomyces vilmorinianum TaxID=3051092 RepID=UPI0020C7B50A|nr:hypothetical protein [Streptomyces vilmorinianum]